MAKIKLVVSATIEETFSDFIISKKTKGLAEKTLQSYQSQFQAVARHTDVKMDIAMLQNHLNHPHKLAFICVLFQIRRVGMVKCKAQLRSRQMTIGQTSLHRIIKKVPVQTFQILSQLLPYSPKGTSCQPAGVKTRWVRNPQDRASSITSGRWLQIWSTWWLSQFSTIAPPKS